MKIAMAASECLPFAKTGGLGDVLGALPKELVKAGHEVLVFLPFYEVIPEELRNRFHDELPLTFPFGGETTSCMTKRYEEGGIVFLFMDQPEVFGHGGIYGGPNNDERFLFFCRAVLERLLLEEAPPDMLHVHDWHTAIMPFLLKDDARYKALHAVMRSVLTIHNLQFQGTAPVEQAAGFLGMDAAELEDKELLWNGQFNALKAGILYADRLSTVSPTYRDETLTKRYGERLEKVLQQRQGEYSGIVNGIDTEFYNPASDKAIEREYDLTSVEQKAVNKRAIQRKFGLPENGEIPLAVMVSRLSGQKGIDVLQEELTEILEKEPLQFVLLGSGEQQYEAFFRGLAEQFPESVAAHIGFDEPLAHLLYAGADLFLMPSHFEPCGLSQLISMQYGTVPVVNRTGGLKDTVTEYDPVLHAGNGFLSDFAEGESFADALSRALAMYRSPEHWLKIKENGMSRDDSWSKSAQKYEELYIQTAGK